MRELILGKTSEEARAELEKAGMKGNALDALLPHKVSPHFFFQSLIWD